MSERKEMSTETRSLIAAVLCLVVIAAWSLIYKPPQPASGQARRRAAANPATPAPGAVCSASAVDGKRPRRPPRL